FAHCPEDAHASLDSPALSSSPLAARHPDPDPGRRLPARQRDSQHLQRAIASIVHDRRIRSDVAFLWPARSDPQLPRAGRSVKSDRVLTRSRHMRRSWKRNASRAVSARSTTWLLLAIAALPLFQFFTGCFPNIPGLVNLPGAIN